MHTCSIFAIHAKYMALPTKSSMVTKMLEQKELSMFLMEKKEKASISKGQRNQRKTSSQSEGYSSK